MDRNGREMIAELKASRPNVAITVTREEDHYCSWDGDGPNPRDEGFTCYTYTVTAQTILDGQIHEGYASLGSCWYKDDDHSEAEQEIGGYLPQMIDEALEDLDAQTGGAQS